MCRHHMPGRLWAICVFTVLRILSRSDTFREDPGRLFNRPFCSVYPGGLRAVAAMCHHIYEHIFDYNFRLLSDETIYALASAYYGLKPAKNWTDVFCFLSEAETIDVDILRGKLKFRWKRFANWRPIYGKYLVHWTTEGSRGDLYRREAAALEPVAAQGRHAPFAVRLRIKAVSLRCYLTEHLTPAVPESLKGIIVRFWSKLHKQ